MARVLFRTGKVITLLAGALAVFTAGISVFTSGSQSPGADISSETISSAIAPDTSIGEETESSTSIIQKTLFSTQKDEIVTDRTPDKRVWEVVRRYNVTDTQTGEVTIEEKTSRIVEVGTGICYQDQAGQYQPADVRWQQDEDGFYIDKANYQLRAGKTVGEWLTYIVDNKSVQLRPSDIRLKDDRQSYSIAQVNLYSQAAIDPEDSTKLVYKDAFGLGIDLEYSANPAGYHQNVIFQKSIDKIDVLSDSQVAIYTELKMDDGQKDNTIEVAVQDTKSSHQFSELTETEPTDNELCFYKSSKKDGKDVRESWWQFGKSEVFDTPNQSEKNTTYAQKQIIREQSGNTYLVETIDGKYFQEATYPVVWDYQTVSGTITTNTVWYANNTYYVSSIFSITQGELKIEPGTVIKFDTGMKFITCYGSGKITAIGDSYLPIVFTSKNDDSNGEVITGSNGQPAMNDYWGGVYAPASQVNISFCRFLYAKLALNLSSPSNTVKTIRNNIFSNCYEGIHYYYASSPISIENNLFMNCQTGIFLQCSGGSVLQNNTIKSCVTGINSGTPSVVVRNNLITNCTTGFLKYTGNYTFDHNAYWGNTNNFSNAQMGTNDIQLTASPYNSASSTFDGLGKYYLNTDPNGGERLKDGGSYSITNTSSCYKDDPNAWSIYHVPADDIHGFSADTTFSEDTIWQPNYDTCDTGTVAIGYHHPRVDYLVDSAYFTVDHNSLEILPGTIIALNAKTQDSAVVVNNGNGKWHGNPFVGGYIHFLDCGRFTQECKINHPDYWSYTYVIDGSVSAEFCKIYGLDEGLGVDSSLLSMHDCIFMLNKTGLYVSYAPIQVENCLFSGSDIAVQFSEYQSSLESRRIANVSFDRNIIGIAFDVYEEQMQLNLQNNIFSKNTIGIDDNSSGSTIQLTENHNVFYQNTTHMDSTLGSLSSTDWADPDDPNSVLLNGNPYDATWTTFSDRFHLIADSNAVDGGYDPNSKGMCGYTTAINNTEDAAPIDIGYHYPLSVDTDGEGLLDYDEYWLGTDPNYADSDNDNLTDYQEVRTYHTDPLNADSDNDGMPDGWEVQYGLNPLNNADAPQDADQDGLTNVEEYNHGTNPLLADSDEDGMPDKWEIDNSFNPNNAEDAAQDADNDGLTNLGEYTAQTDSHDADSDDDGMPDGWEVDHNLDPLSSSDKTTDFDSDGYINYVEYLHNSAPNNSNSLPATTTTITVPTITSSIQQAIDWSIDGDTIRILPGVYAESINYNGKAIRITGVSPYDWKNSVQKTIINAGGFSAGVSFNSGEDANSILEGVMIANLAEYKNGNYGIQCNSGSSPTIRWCIVENNGSDGIHSVSSSPRISNCMVGLNGGNGVSLSSTGLYIKNNWIYNNHTNGLYIASITDYETIQNNTLVGNLGYGLIYSGDPNTAPRILNSIFWANTQNNVQGCQAEYCCIQDGGTGTNISSNPLFFDPNNYDYRIEKESPCVNAGDPNTVCDFNEKDITGQVRLAGRIDIGADEVCAIWNLTQDIWYNDSIQQAIDEAEPNDIIQLHEWVFTENLNYQGKSITLQSTDPNNWKTVERTVIQAADPNLAVITFNSNEQADSVIKGIRLQNGQWGVLCDNSSPQITRCWIRNNYIGVLCDEGSPQIINNKISHNGGQLGAGIWVSSAIPPVIVGNLIYKNDNGIIYADTVSEGIILNNTIADNYSVNPNNTGFGIYVYPSAADPNVANCIVWGNDDDLDGVTAKYSCIKTVTDANGIGNIVKNPQFADEEEDNYQITLTSPCLSLGDPNIVGQYQDIESRSIVMAASALPDSISGQSGDVVAATGAATVNFWYVSKNLCAWPTAPAGYRKTYLQDALTVAADGDEVWVAEGTYRPEEDTANPNGSGDTSKSFILKDGFKLKGGFPSLGGSEAQRNRDKYPTILSGQIAVLAVHAEHVITGINITASTVLDGFIIRDGGRRFNGNDCGAGIYLENSLMKISDCILRENDSPRGAAIYCNNSSLEINNCDFIDNLSSSTMYGGCFGVYSENQSSLVIMNCTFTDPEIGGGIESHLISSRSGSYLTIKQSKFISLTGTPIVCDGATIEGCVFANNSAINSGGIVCAGDLWVLNSVFINNTAKSVSDYGIYGNGGAIQHHDGLLVIFNCTFFGNHAENWSGAIRGQDSYICIYNSILWASTDSWGGGRGSHMSAGGQSWIDIQNSCIEGQPTYPGTGNTNQDPLFVDTSNPIGDDGIWGTVDDGLRIQFQTSPISPCIDTGNDTAVNGITLDITSNDRVVDGNKDGTAHVDMGAYEMPNVWFVDRDPSITATRDGSSWSQACATLTDALSRANGKTGEIWVANGTYTPGTSRTDTFQLVENVAVYGGFKGFSEGSNAENSRLQRDQFPTHNNTELSGYIDSSNRVYHVVKGANNAVLDGFKIINCRADGTDSEAYGGGLFCTDTTMTLRFCYFYDNSAYYGGAFYANNSALKFENCFLYHNSAIGGGCGYCVNSDIIFINCTTFFNHATKCGGIHADNSKIYLLNTIFWGNPDEGRTINDGYGFDLAINSSVIAEYSDLPDSFYNDGTGSMSLQNCINKNPRFVRSSGEPFNYHEASVVGYFSGFDTIDGTWTFSNAMSPCIDAGSPSSLCSNEPSPNGNRINMGFYGNTNEASKSLSCTNEYDKIYASDGYVNDNFGGKINPYYQSFYITGKAVDIDGEYAIVGAPVHDFSGVDSGAAYIYKKEGNRWIQQVNLAGCLDSGDLESQDYFGLSVAISGEYAIVGAPYDDTIASSSGCAYTFKRQGESWIKLGKLYMSDGAAGDILGYSVAIKAGTALVGCPFKENGSRIDAGRVYIWKYTDGNWQYNTHIITSAALSHDCFGYAIDFDGNRAIISAPGYDTSNNYGKALIFKKNSDDTWTQENFSTGSYCGGSSFTEGYFARVVGISGNYAVIPRQYYNAYSIDGLYCSVVIYKYNGVQWVVDGTFTYQDARKSIAVDIDDDKIIVGAYCNAIYETSKYEHSGKAYLIRRNGDRWDHEWQRQLSPASLVYEDLFGASVGISGNNIVISAPSDDTLAQNAGAVYMFNTESWSW